MRSSSLVLGFIVCLLLSLTTGVFGAETDEAALGQSVTLHSGVAEYHLINWWLENSNIAQCRVNTPETRSCEITDERLGDRLKTDNQTGSLTIINISKGLAGLYELQIFDKAFKESYKKFNVTVSAPLPALTIVSPEQSSCPKCLKQCSAVNVTLSWYKGNSSFSSIGVSDLSSGVSVLLKVNEQDFSIYSCVMNDSISSKTKLNITELCQPCPEADLYRALISVLVIAAALGAVASRAVAAVAAAAVVGAAAVVAAAVIYCCCKKRRLARRYGVDCRYDVKRETVSMINNRSDEESPAGIEDLQPTTEWESSGEHLCCVSMHLTRE